MTETPPSKHTALRCLAAVARHHGIDLDVEHLAHEYGLPDTEVDTEVLMRVAHDNGLRCRKRHLAWEALSGLGDSFPLIARLANGNSVVFAGFRGGEAGAAEVVVLDPLATSPNFLFITRDRLERLWTGETILVHRAYNLGDENRPFGLLWFVPELIRNRGDFTAVAVAALLLAAIGLITPIFFQLVIDKVLVHNSEATLRVLGLGVVLAILFEAAFKSLRGLILLGVTNRIDMRLTRRTFSHLMQLPLLFFETSATGVLTKHMQQTEKIRAFLTGRVLSTLLDSVTLVFFLPVLLSYSLVMGGLVFLFAAGIALTFVAILPIYRQQLLALYDAEGRRQAMLVETIQGMRTVKALALEARKRQHWNDQSANAILRLNRVGRTTVVADAIVGFLQQLGTVAIVWVGAELVFAGRLTVGELVAIQMLAGRVSAPLVQMVSLVNEFQEIRLSLRMLGEVMSRRPERVSGTGLQPRLSGAVVFENVSFSYPDSNAPALQGVSFTIPAGSLVGVVGRSGCGKSTLLRLLQGLHLPQAGLIKFDGYELREIDLQHLRRSVGVVIQESFLFNDTVRNNIAITRPECEFAEVVAAARAAGADEFIQRLPHGYDTVLEENAANLSGGQKQRLSIARSLLLNPRILLFDEATSALDPESEAIINQNLDQIRRGKTLMIVTHRLSTIARADLILVLDGGHIHACGTHSELVRMNELYRHLWREQTRHLTPDSIRSLDW